MHIKHFFLSILVSMVAGTSWAQAPSNDLCSDAIDLTQFLGYGLGALQQTDSYSNLEATGEEELEDALPADWGDGSVDQSVWFHFTGDGNTYQFRTLNCAGAAFYSNDTQMALYKGSCDALELVHANDDLNGFWDINYGWYYSFVDAKLDEGADYFLMVDGFNWTDNDFWEGVAQGTFCMTVMQTQNMGDHVSCDAALAIDEVFQAQGNDLSIVGPFNNTPAGSGIEPAPNATPMGIECWNDGPTDDGSVWFTFEGDGNPYTITHTFCDADNFTYFWGWDSQMALYKGNCDEMVPVTCAEDFDGDLFQWWAEVGFDSEEGETYFLRMDGFHWNFNGFEWVAGGSFCLQAFPGNVNSVPLREDLSLEAFPNPSTDGRLRLNWGGEDVRGDVGVFDVTGRQLGLILNVIRGEEITLDVPTGAYVLRVKTESGTASVQVQVAH